MEHTSNENIAEALKLLEHAAIQKKDELKHVLSDKYTNLRGLIIENDGSLLNTLANAKQHALDAVVHAKDAGVEKARDIARDVDQRVHQNPWPYLAGSAAAGLFIGYLLGRNRK
ncbi:MAG: DUF883 family protein [Kiritimatiellia bacterium]